MVPSGHVSVVSVTVAFGPAVPTMLVFVTPTVAPGDRVPVSLDVPPVTVRLTGEAERVTDPFAPCNVILLYVPAVVLDEV